MMQPKPWTDEDKQLGVLPEIDSQITVEYVERKEARFCVDCRKARFLGRTLNDEGAWRWVVRYSDGNCDVIPPEICYPVSSSFNDRDFADLVNSLRDTAIEYAGTQQLRERIATTLRDMKFYRGLLASSLKLPVEQESPDTKRLDWLLNSAGDEIWQTVLFGHRGCKTPREAIDAAIKDGEQ